MKQEYQNWIDNCTSERKVVAGFCYSVSILMQKEFPELALCRGYVIDGWENKHTHWFLKTNDGEIIDPTVSQFDYLLVAGQLKYEEYNEVMHGPLAVGKCADCGSNKKIFFHKSRD